MPGAASKEAREAPASECREERLSSDCVPSETGLIQPPDGDESTASLLDQNGEDQSHLLKDFCPKKAAENPTKTWLDKHGVRWSVNLVGKVLKEMAPKSFKLVNFEDAPAFLQDNIFIQSGYRAFFSTKQCLKSVVKLHNETMNIWTHLVGFMVFNTIMWICNFGYLSTWADRLVFSIFFLSAQKMLASSSVFHIFCCKSARAYGKLSCLDFSGIAIMIGGSAFAGIYFVFSGHVGWQITYISLIVVLTLAMIVLPLYSWFHSHRFRVLRALLYAAFGIAGIVPLLHWFLSFTNLEFEAVKVLLWFAGNAVYLIGVIFYTQRIPERWWPGKFDIWANSHQIWHLFVVAAALLHYKALIVAHTWALNVVV